MFDKLIASEPESADFKNRRRYFVTSSVVVGVLFLAAVVASIFAADFSLGSGSFELAQMLTPVEMAAVEPETPQAQRQNNQSQTSNLPSRTANIPRLDESPTVIPTTTSTTRNTEVTRPIGRFINGAKFNSDPVAGTSSGRNTSGVSGPSTDGLVQTAINDKDEDIQLPPREVKKPVAPRPPVSKGPLNGYAKSLPKPIYTAAAKAVRANGSVMVQVIIDERGNVISANAMNGHPMLKAEAEKAARSAKFSPTTLGDVPVKVTGVITYNFIL